MRRAEVFVVVAIFAIPVLMVALQLHMVFLHRREPRLLVARIGVESLCARIASEGPRKGRQLDSHIVEVDGKFLCIVGDPRISRYEIAAVIDRESVTTEGTR